MTIDLDINSHLNAKICVIGIGGAGGNAVDNMIRRGVEGVTFITANTDKQALDKTLASEKILLGANFTKGLGAGAKPEVGKKAAEESADIIKTTLEGFNLIFITCGMGGGTGTGGSPIVAKIAKETGALVVGIVSKCFSREGTNKMLLAETGIAALRDSLDAIIVIPNDKILEVCKGIKPRDAYSKANDILYNAVQGIVKIIVNDSHINVDFADIRTTLADTGEVIIATGTGTGENAARESVRNALKSPFLEGLTIQKASGILFNIHAGNHSFDQVDEAYTALREAAADENVNIIAGEDYDDNSDEFSVTIIAPARKNAGEKNENKIQQEEKNPTVEESKTEDTTLEVRALRTKKPATRPVEKINLFTFDSSPIKDEPISNPSDFINPTNRITNVASATEKPVENLEVIAGPQIPPAISRFGRPHGDDELKAYDVPSYLRRGKGESKYNVNATDEINVNRITTNDIINMASSEANATNILPAKEDRQKIQDFVNTVMEKPTNKFVYHLAERGLKTE